MYPPAILILQEQFTSYWYMAKRSFGWCLPFSFDQGSSKPKHLFTGESSERVFFLDLHFPAEVCFFVSSPATILTYKLRVNNEFPDQIKISTNHNSTEMIIFVPFCSRFAFTMYFCHWISFCGVVFLPLGSDERENPEYYENLNLYYNLTLVGIKSRNNDDSI